MKYSKDNIAEYRNSRTLTCILCPNGCEINVEYASAKPEISSGDIEIVSIIGNRCGKGADYVEQELKNPVRNIASSVLVDGGEMPLCSVRLSRPIPKARIFDVMDEIKKVRIKAPVSAGEIIIPNVLNLNSDVIATGSVIEREAD